jgi:hypothetical protein
MRKLCMDCRFSVFRTGGCICARPTKEIVCSNEIAKCYFGLNRSCIKERCPSWWNRLTRRDVCGPGGKYYVAK